MSSLPSLGQRATDKVASSRGEELMAEISKEMAEATTAELLDSDIERAQSILGVDHASRHREHLTTVTPDAIRNFAYGVGDDNPLFADEDYGRSTRWGSQIAPGIMAGIVNTPMLGDKPSEEYKAATKSLFRGIHVFVSGGTWDWFRPLYPGDRLFSYSGQESIDVKESEFGGRSVIRVSREVKFNQRAEVIGVYRVLTVLTERKTARDRGKYSEIEPASYTDEQLEAIEALYATEERRGATTRYFEDVEVGEALPSMVKGPLTVTDVIAFHAGGYGFVPYGLPPNRLAHQNRQRIAPFYVKDEQGIPDVAQRLHWNSSWANAIGNPMAYDYGVMRECHFLHYLTDWAGDDAFVVRQHDSIRKFNYMGDTQFLSGKVVGKREEDGQCLVDLEMKMTNQRQVETTFGEATISLPSRVHGSAAIPSTPLEIERRTQEMYSRHLELKAGS